MGPRSQEGKAATAVIKQLNVLEFHDGAFAYMLSNANTAIQKRLFNTFMHLIRIWAARYDGGIIDDDEMAMFVNSKRIMECMEKWGYAFNDGMRMTD